MNKFEYISENSHTVVSESCLYYLTIGNWFHNFRLLYLQWKIWMYLVTYNLFSNTHWLKEEKDFSLVFIWFLLKNPKYYYFIEYTEETSIIALFYTFVEIRITIIRWLWELKIDQLHYLIIYHRFNVKNYLLAVTLRTIQP